MKSVLSAGGVSTDEINPERMESKKIKNLFFAGEIIDVDGICGGYNLHFAWASGMIAGGFTDFIFINCMTRLIMYF